MFENKTTFRDVVAFCVGLMFETLLDPLLFAFAVFLIFPRIQAVLDRLSKGQGLEAAVLGDAVTSPAPYIVFLIVFLIWFVFKGRRYADEAKEKEEQTKTLKSIAGKLDTLIDEIRQDRNERNKSDTPNV